MSVPQTQIILTMSPDAAVLRAACSADAHRDTGVVLDEWQEVTFGAVEWHSIDEDRDVARARLVRLTAAAHRAVPS